MRHRKALATFSDHDFLHRLVVADLVDRLETITRNFERAVIVGPGAELLRPALTQKCGVKILFEGKMAWKENTCPPDGRVTLDEEKLPFRPHSFDLYISLMSMHHINDLPNTLGKIRTLLKPDGLMLAAFPGENSLLELRQCLYEAETFITGGVHPHIIPFVKLKDMGQLLQHAGFTLPVADVQTYPVTYRKPARLLEDLRKMGEANILVKGARKTLRRDVLQKAYELYQQNYPARNSDGVKATFDIVTLTGWSPHPDQPKPLAPGSAKISLAEAFKNQPEIKN